MPRNKFKNDSSKLPTDKNALLVIYCKGEYVLVDIKERREFNEVHIPSAINFPVHIFASISYGLPKKKDYCLLQ